MNRRQVAWFMALAMLTLIVTVSAPAFPLQETPDTAAEETAAEMVQDPAEVQADKVDPQGAVESILRQQEQLLQGRRFTYDPAGRRDPFRSLFAAATFEEGKRPKGIAGMLVSELKLTGVVEDSADGDVAMVMGSDNKGYFLRVGDAVFDGTIIAVDPDRGAVTFRQQVDDARLIKPYRDVVKRLEPLEEFADE